MATRDYALRVSKSFINECIANGINFYKVFMFGSAARDEMHAGSDIDLILVSDQFNENVFDNLKLYSKINVKYPNIETHPFPKTYFLQGDDFLSQIKNECIEITN